MQITKLNKRPQQTELQNLKAGDCFSTEHGEVYMRIRSNAGTVSTDVSVIALPGAATTTLPALAMVWPMESNMEVSYQWERS